MPAEVQNCFIIIFLPAIYSTHRDPNTRVGVEESFQAYEASLWIIFSQSLVTLRLWPLVTKWEKETKIFKRVLEHVLQSHRNVSYQRSLGNVNIKKHHRKSIRTFCLISRAKDFHLKAAMKCSEEFSPAFLLLHFLMVTSTSLCLWGTMEIENLPDWNKCSQLSSMK